MSDFSLVFVQTKQFWGWVLHWSLRPLWLLEALRGRCSLIVSMHLWITRMLTWLVERNSLSLREILRFYLHTPYLEMISLIKPQIQRKKTKVIARMSICQGLPLCSNMNRGFIFSLQSKTTKNSTLPLYMMVPGSMDTDVLSSSESTVLLFSCFRWVEVVLWHWIKT